MRETYDAEILRQPALAAAPPAIGPRLGIVGGGQLARMTAMAALQLGCDVVVVERNPFSPAAMSARLCFRRQCPNVLGSKLRGPRASTGSEQKRPPAKDCSGKTLLVRPVFGFISGWHQRPA